MSSAIYKFDYMNTDVFPEAIIGHMVYMTLNHLREYCHDGNIEHLSEARKLIIDIGVDQAHREELEGIKRGDVDDQINPDHYKKNNIEVIELIDDIIEEGQAYYIGNIIKYITRYRRKKGTVDIKKALWYIDRLAKKVNGLNMLSNTFNKAPYSPY